MRLIAGFSPARTAIVAVLGAAGLSGCMSQPVTYGTGVSTSQQTFRDITGLVDLKKRPPSIDYEPRPAVVVPPKDASLPPPGSGGPPSPDWPVDPTAAAKARTGGPMLDPADAARMDPDIRMHVAGPTTVQWYDSNKDTPGARAKGTDAQDANAAKMFAKLKSGMGEERDANGNPIRTTLVEPPTDYRVPDPSAPTEFKDKKKFRWPWLSNGRNTSEPDTSSVVGPPSGGSSD